VTTQILGAQAAVDALIERFGTPEAAQLTFTVGAELSEGLRMDVDIRKHRITVDEPKALGGTDEGPNPVELVLAALTTCQAITYRVWAMKLGIALDSVHVEADGDIDLRGFFGVDDSVRPGYSEVRLRVRLDGPESPERYAELAEAVDGHCPVLDFTGNPVPIQRTLV
jgi:uncharacterized OsmC-like protein